MSRARLGDQSDPFTVRSCRQNRVGQAAPHDQLCPARDDQSVQSCSILMATSSTVIGDVSIS